MESQGCPEPVPGGARNPARISAQRCNREDWAHELQPPQAELGSLEKMEARQQFSCCSVAILLLQFERRFGGGAPRGARQWDATPLRHSWQLNSHQLHRATGALATIQREATGFLERLPNASNCILRPFLLSVKDAADSVQQPSASVQWVLGNERTPQ